jgi:hypothetical protein
MLILHLYNLSKLSFSSSRLSYIGSFKQRVKFAGATVAQKPKAGSKRFVLLVDMDCFFAAVALKNFPQFKNAPVAVGHCPTVELKSPDVTHISSPSKDPNNSSSELSTCNYIARKFGVRKGMFLGDAIKVRCLHLFDLWLGILKSNLVSLFTLSCALSLLFFPMISLNMKKSLELLRRSCIILLINFMDM